ncbi:MAG: hypothetical protein KC708_24915, partial [Anaerolineae bacterium]|nr:hypothetical protein [Anaerolineae bacterium]
MKRQNNLMRVILHRLPFLLVIVLVGIFAGVSHLSASQGQQVQVEQPAQADELTTMVVGYVGDLELGVSIAENDGEAGLLRFADIFREYGTELRRISLDNPISSDIDLLLMVHPRQPLNVVQSTYIWQHLERGHHLLLAIDPNSLDRVRTFRSRDGLSQLLFNDYGIRIDDTALIYPWVTENSLVDIRDNWGAVQPESLVSHPVMDPLVRYGVPVFTWFTRSLTVESVGVNSEASVLLYTDHAFGETSTNFSETTDVSLNFNIGADAQGRLPVAALATNIETGSRVAVLGDSEMIQNLFGMTQRSATNGEPTYPGNRILAERLAGWLLGLSSDHYLPLPVGFTWLALDGDNEDWANRESVTIVADNEGDVANASDDIIS